MGRDPRAEEIDSGKTISPATISSLVEGNKPDAVCAGLVFLSNISAFGKRL